MSGDAGQRPPPVRCVLLFCLALPAVATHSAITAGISSVQEQQQQQQQQQQQAGAISASSATSSRRLLQSPGGCAPGKQLCGGKCVSTSSNPAACGSNCTRCKAPKPAGSGSAVCINSACSVSCKQGYERKGSSCRVCGKGRYKPTAGPGACSSCPTGTTTTGRAASDHDEWRDCVPGGLIPATKQTGSSSLQKLQDFEGEWIRALNNTGGRGGGRGGSGGGKGSKGKTRACLYGCDALEWNDEIERASIHVGHLAGSPLTYSSNNPADVFAGVNLVGAVRDQSQCATCVSHAIVSAATSAVAAALAVDARQIIMSPVFSYYCGHVFKLGSLGRSCSSGWGFNEALELAGERPEVFFVNGTCLNGTDIQRTALNNGALLRPQCQSAVSRCPTAAFTCVPNLLSEGIVRIQREIRWQGGVMTRIMVDSAFRKFFESSPTGVFNGPTDPSDAIYHAVLLVGQHSLVSMPEAPSNARSTSNVRSSTCTVDLLNECCVLVGSLHPSDAGYNNLEFYWLALNSWGESWGDKGLFRIGYGVADVGHPEDTYSLSDCFTTSTDPATVAAWSRPRPVAADPSAPGCYFYKAVAKDSISGIADHFQVDILQLVKDNVARGVIPLLKPPNGTSQEPQLQPPFASWAGTTFRVCDIPDFLFSRVATVAAPPSPPPSPPPPSSPPPPPSPPPPRPPPPLPPSPPPPSPPSPSPPSPPPPPSPPALGPQAQQMEALLSIKADLVGPTGVGSITPLDSWTRDSGSDGGYCTWLGVSCDEFKNVTEIEISSANAENGTLGGTLPNSDSWLALSGLRQLKLLKCELKPSALPVVWARMPALEYIEMSGTWQAMGLAATLPPEWSEMPALRSLDLFEVGLVGTIPASWARMARLSRLHLGGNSLNGSLPQLPSGLTFLNVAWNQLSGTLPLLPSGLQQLWVGGNDFSGKPVSTFELSNLQFIQLSWNRFDGFLPDAGVVWPLMQSLALDGCGFSGTIPASYSRMANLTFLGLGGNDRLTGTLPASLATLSMLESFDASYCNLSGTIPTAWGPGLASLTRFDVSDNPNLEGCVPAEFQGRTVNTNGTRISGFCV